MKKILLLAFICISTFVRAQATLDSLPRIDGKISYQNIVDVPNKSKDFIFAAANKWMLDTFKGRNGGIQSADKEQGQIIGENSFKLAHEASDFFHAPMGYTFKFKIQIDCKDGKYRIQLYDITYFIDHPSTDPSLDDIELYNFGLARSKNKNLHQNAYSVDAQFKAVMQSLADAVNKAAKDDF